METMSQAGLIAFVERLLGRAWKLGAQGPEAYDCWSLLRHVEREVFGRVLPQVVLPEKTGPDRIAEILSSHPKRSLWRQAAAPSHGGGVEMTSVRAPLHVGVWLDLDGGLVLHCAQGAGVSLDSLLNLKALGWSRFRFYDFVGEPGGPAPGAGAAQAAEAA